MKSALITFHDANNYGAALQAAATYKVLSKYSECVLVDYYNPIISGQMDLIRFRGGNLKRIIHDLLRLIPRRKALLKFKGFISKNTQKTGRVYDREGFAKIVSDIDIVIAGSDQIWNPECQTESSAIDGNYFLDIPGEFSKVSYASSFGDYSFSEEQRKKIYSLLSGFRYLSVREQDAANYISDLLNKHVAHVLDPTLLLGRVEWLTMGERPNINLPSKFILVYQLNNNDLNRATIDHVKRTTGIEHIFSIDQGFLKKHKGLVQIRNIGPAEFIYLFDKASVVITDSFHGCCFSVNFQKPFLAIAPPKRANRIESLFNKLGLDEQLIKSNSDFLDKTVEYDVHLVSSNLKKLKEESLAYISGCFKIYD